MLKAPEPLTALGLNHLWQCALYLPSGWHDHRFPLTHFGHLLCESLQQQSVVILGRRSAGPHSAFRVKPPRTTVFLQDEQGVEIGVTLFGDTRALALEQSDWLAFEGVLSVHQDKLWLRNPRWIALHSLDRLQPQYPGKPKVIKAERVTQLMGTVLDRAIEQGAQCIEQHLSASPLSASQRHSLGLESPNAVYELLIDAHTPFSVAAGEQAHQRLERLAACLQIGQLKHSDPPLPRAPLIITDTVAQAIPSALGFALTPDQHQAVASLLASLRSDHAVRHLISGDVGSGKTAVFTCAAAACAAAGGRCAILAPTAPLAQQIERNLRGWWPWLNTALVTGQSAGGNLNVPGACLVGTTALLHASIEGLDLVIVDEQQKFSVKQRETLLGEHRSAHLVEATATCIPRSLALLKYGNWRVSRLRNGFVDKHIATHIWRRDQCPQLAREIMRGIGETIRDGGQVLVVYPLREQKGNNHLAVHGAKESFERWFPGRVAAIDGAMSDHDKHKALAAMADNTADVLVATSVVEVGIDLPDMRRAVVVHPQRLGLTMLHQIRGRVARRGGRGDFDLFVVDPLSPSSEQRLMALTQTNDGFEIAEMDMRLRGVGDLGVESRHQSGADASLLINRSLSIDALDWAAEHLKTG